MRAKFNCASVTDFGNGQKQIKMVAATTSAPDDNDFSEYTPCGDLSMTVTAKAEKAQTFFKPGKSYYLNFSEIEQSS